MTGITVGGETGLLVVRIGRLVIVGAVAIDTVGWRSGVPPVGMTQATVDGLVFPVELPHQAMVKARAQPTVGR